MDVRYKIGELEFVVMPAVQFDALPLADVLPDAPQYVVSPCTPSRRPLTAAADVAVGLVIVGGGFAVIAFVLWLVAIEPMLDVALTAGWFVVGG